MDNEELNNSIDMKVSLKQSKFDIIKIDRVNNKDSRNGS